MPFVPEEVVDENEDQDEEGPDEDQQSLQTECVVLLQMLIDYKPSIQADMEEDGIELDASSTACVEVSWDGALNRRFFHVPEVCHLLAKSSKDKLVQEVDRSNPENKLLDFLDRANNLYREIKHQEFLTEVGVAKVFSPAVHNTTTWISFFLSLIINGLFAAYYEVKAGDEVRDPTDDQDDEYNATLDFNENPFITDPNNVAIPDNIRSAINVLNYIQLGTSFFTIVLTFVVRSPVIAWGLSEDPDISSKWEIALYTALDPMTLYYCWYFLFACLGAFYHDMFITFLLLDLIVKNPTTADILNSVVIPRAQLGVAFVLGAFTIYIYTFFIFIFMPYRILSDDDGTPGGSDEMDCETLWGCYKFIFGYGFRQGGGVGDIMYHDVGAPMLIHYTFFLIVTVAMLNIIFGIIIDTFSGLRSEKNDRNYDTTETCFICSVHRQVFDRAANSPVGFKNHIRNDHNMWSYLNFVFFLWEQDKDDDDGLEYYVRHKIISNEITWIPMHKAMCLDLGETDMEVMRGEVFSAISKTEADLLSKVGELQSDTNVFLDRISKAVEQDYANSASVKVGISAFLAQAAMMQGTLEGVSLAETSAGFGMDDETVRSLEMQNKGPVKLTVHLDSMTLPHLKTEEDFMSNYVIIRHHNGNAHEEKASKYDEETQQLFFEPQHVLVSDDINNEKEVDLKKIVVQLMHSDPESPTAMLVGTVDLSVKELSEQTDYIQLEKHFKVGDVDCIAKVSTVKQEEGNESLASSNGGRGGSRGGSRGGRRVSRRPSMASRGSDSEQKGN